MPQRKPEDECFGSSQDCQLIHHSGQLWPFQKLSTPASLELYHCPQGGNQSAMDPSDTWVNGDWWQRSNLPRTTGCPGDSELGESVGLLFSTA